MGKVLHIIIIIIIRPSNNKTLTFGQQEAEVSQANKQFEEGIQFRDFLIPNSYSSFGGFALPLPHIIIIGDNNNAHDKYPPIGMLPSFGPLRLLSGIWFSGTNITGRSPWVI